MFEVQYPIFRNTLPAVYDDSLSYLEQTQKLYYTVKELVDYVNNFDTSVLADANAYTDGKVNGLRTEIYLKYDGMFVNIEQELKAEIDAVDTKYQNITDSMKADYLQKIQEVYVAIQGLNTDIANLYQNFTKFKILVNNELNSMYGELTDYIDEHISELTQLYVFNPVDGAFTPIQKVVDDLFEYSRGCSLTAQEYDNLRLTASEYDNMRIKAKDYIVKARFLFLDRMYLSMISPFTGATELIKNVVLELANERKNGITALDYDHKQLTANQYEFYHLTAYDYDWNAKNLLV